MLKCDSVHIIYVLCYFKILTKFKNQELIIFHQIKIIREKL